MIIEGLTGTISCPCCGGCSLSPKLLDSIELLIKITGPLHSNSCYRCKSHNAQIGGAEHSQHLISNAFDIQVAKTAQSAFISEARACGFNGIGIGLNFVHIDVRDTPAEWHYNY